MSEILLDDVNSLLEGDFGDDRILKQIARACKNNEVISNYERNYVQKLAEQYLGKKPENTSQQPENTSQQPENTSQQPENTEIIPNVTIPKISTIQSQILESPSPRNSNSILKNPKLFLGFAGVALIIIIAAAILFSDNSDSITSNSEPVIDVKLSIQTDLSSYTQSDLISINGKSVNSNLVNLSIKNQNNELVWAEQISVKSDGKFSTLAIADGSGWENSGSYTVEVDNGSEAKSIKFSFNS